MKYNDEVDEVIDDSVDVFLDKGTQALNNQNDPRLALQFFHKAEIVSPNNAAVHNNLAVCYWTLGEKKKAIEHSTQSVRLSPFELDYVLNCGAILTAEKKIGQSSSIYKNFLKQYPDCTEIQDALHAISFTNVTDNPVTIPEQYVDYTPTFASAIIPAFNGLSNRSIQMLVQESIVTSESILDLGCGIGDYLRYTNSRQHVVAVEPHKPYVEKAKGNYPWVEFHNTDAIQFLSTTQKKFDTIIMMDVAEHLELHNAVTMVKLAAEHCNKILLLQTPFGIHPQDHDLWDCKGEFWQTHRTTWDPKNLDQLGLRFYTVWENWYPWEKGESEKSPDLVLGMWMPEIKKNAFTVIIDYPSINEELLHTIDDLKRQTYPLFEAHIIYDSNSPETLDAIRHSVGIDSRFSLCNRRNNGEMKILLEKMNAQGSDSVISIKSGSHLDQEYLSEKLLKRNELHSSLHPGTVLEETISPEALYDNYRMILAKQSYEMWQQAYRDGYKSTMGDHRNYFYNRYIQEIGFYDILNDASRIVEFAPGDGSFILPFISERTEKDFYLFDISEKNLNTIKQKMLSANNVGFYINDLQPPVLRDIDLSFSFLLCQSMPYTLWKEHLHNVKSMLSEKGRYIFQFAYHPNGSVNDSLGDSIAGNQKYHPEQMKKLLESAGYSNIKMTQPISLKQLQSDILWFLCSAETM